MPPNDVPQFLLRLYRRNHIPEPAKYGFKTKRHSSDVKAEDKEQLRLTHITEAYNRQLYIIESSAPLSMSADWWWTLRQAHLRETVFGFDVGIAIILTVELLEDPTDVRHLHPFSKASSEYMVENKIPADAVVGTFPYYAIHELDLTKYTKSSFRFEPYCAPIVEDGIRRVTPLRMVIERLWDDLKGNDDVTKAKTLGNMARELFIPAIHKLCPDAFRDEEDLEIFGDGFFLPDWWSNSPMDKKAFDKGFVKAARAKPLIGELNRR